MQSEAWKSVCFLHNEETMRRIGSNFICCNLSQARPPTLDPGAFCKKSHHDARWWKYADMTGSNHNEVVIKRNNSDIRFQFFVFKFHTSKNMHITMRSENKNEVLQNCKKLILWRCVRYRTETRKKKKVSAKKCVKIVISCETYLDSIDKMVPN